MRRSLCPPLSTTRALKLSELEKEKKKNKKTPKRKQSPKKIGLSKDEREAQLMKKSVADLIQIYQDYYNRFEQGLREQSKLEALRLEIIDEIQEIQRETSEIEKEIPHSPTKSPQASPSPRRTSFGKSCSDITFRKDIIDLSPIRK